MLSFTKPELFKLNFHKKHHFDYKNDIPIFMRPDNCDYAKYNLHFPSVKYESKTGNAALRMGIPDWVAFDNQILRFEATSQEEQAPFLRGKQHLFKILYFLEDDTIQVVEINPANDSRFRGTVLKRHKIPKPGLRDENFFTVDDFNVNKDVLFYGTKYRIFNCDKYTRDYLTKLGIEVPDPNLQFFPANEQFKDRPFSCPQYVQPRHHPFKQFLEYDGNILIYNCVWAKCENAKKATEKFLLLYYLSDDTIEIRQQQDVIREINGKRPKSKILIRRSKIPKERPVEPLPGLKLKQDLTVDERQDYYTDKDLQIGSVINAWGRQLLIYDCDNFTRKFLNLKYGIHVQSLQVDGLEEISNSKKEAEVAENKTPALKSMEKTSPAIGTDGKVTRRDFVKFMTKDRKGYDSHILRFLGRMPNSGNQNRRFIISYFLVDDTILIYEQPQRNSGYLGGKFMDRCHVRKWRENGYVGVRDLYIGAHVCLNGHKFEILDADEYALNYMENHVDEFPVSNRLWILRKLKNIIGTSTRELKKSFAENESKDTGLINGENFMNLMRRLASSNLTNHEILTLKRSYAMRQVIKGTTDHDECVPIGLQLPTPSSVPGPFTSLFILQIELKKQQFSEFQSLLSYLQQQDIARSGLLNKYLVLRLSLAFPLPVKKHIISDVLASFATENDEVYYEDFVSAIDWKTNPATNAFTRDIADERYELIDYKEMIKELEELDSEKCEK